MACNVRVVAKSGDDGYLATKNLIKAFRKEVSNAGILHEYKRHEFYEKPSEVRRRKVLQRQRDIAKLKQRQRRRK